MIQLLIEPRDPLIFRDGKPFSAGLSATTLEFPPPSATVGMLRTVLGEPSSYANLSDLRNVAQTGPFFVSTSDDGTTWEYAFSAPADAVSYRAGDSLALFPLRPAALDSGEGVLHPPVPQFLLHAGPGDDKKPVRPPPFWSWPFYEKWLLNAQPQSAPERQIGPPPIARHKRMHVEIEKNSQTAKDARLFATESLEFMPQRPDSAPRVQRLRTRFALVSHFTVPESVASIPLPRLALLGGESRMAALTPSGPPLPTCPLALQNAKRLRLILATPGDFDQGWKPGWLKPEGGSPPDCPNLALTLVAAAVPRGFPLSGWDLAATPPAPKRSRLLAPAGSVYFCEAQGDPSALWLKSICTGPPALDGFGIVTLGVW